MIAPKLLLLLLSLLATLADSADDSLKTQKANQVLYSCTLDIWQLPLSNIRLTIRYIQPKNIQLDSDRLANYELTNEDFEFKVLPPQASLAQLEASGFEPELPFVFFINGFNQNTNFNDTWMFNVGNQMTRFKRKHKSGFSLRANVVFLNWYIENLFVSNALAMAPAYYKTMANYELILSYITENILHIIDFFDYKLPSRSEFDRRKYFSQFEFYGHSLGAHIISDAIVSIHSARPNFKFGKLVGLDPAIPCFNSASHGISAAKTAASVDRVTIIHSNAAIIGLGANRAHEEIVLNGGTFQPSCGWYDFSCHHSRSTEIFTYIDDTCQMVAYSCANYQQFKLGACQTCRQAESKNNQLRGGCILVNLPEQHVDDSIDYQWPDSSPRRSSLIESHAVSSNRLTYRHQRGIFEPFVNKSHFHYVNTNPNFHDSRSHCLQHYQLRLLILDRDLEIEECKMSQFTVGEAPNGARVRLRAQKNEFAPATLAKNSSDSYTKVLTNIIDTKLHTGLMTFSGEAKVFSECELSGVHFNKWAQCFKTYRGSAGIDFVLDVAFMSHTKKVVRDGHSTVLCGRWNPQQEQPADGALALTLCRSDQLVNVSSRIRELRDEVTFGHQYESWQESLLNSLASLFVEWEPFRSQYNHN